MGDTTLSGNGVVTMTGVPTSPGPVSGAQIGTDGNGRTLTIDSGVTVQGSGSVGVNSIVDPNLNLGNAGTINANSTTNALQIGGDGSVTNTGTFKASGGGTLDLVTSNPINNATGNITADNGVVNVSTTIQGGTLNTLNGGVMQTTAGGAKLDGSAQGAITLSDGSTYTSTAGKTQILGTLNLGTATGSTLTLGGALELVGDATLSGPGVVNISGDASTSTGGQIGTDGNGRTLTNDATIQGSGTIGSNNATSDNLAVINGGTIKANTSGQELLMMGTGPVTNTGTLQVDPSSTLVVTSTLTNFSGNTLTGGTYIVNGAAGSTGTMQLSSLGSNANGEIVNNAANIVLNGPNANTLLIDAGGNNALTPLAANTTASSSLTIEGGYSFTTVGDFSNAGTVKVLASSALTVGTGGANAYSQSGGLTKVNGTLTAASVTLTGGTLNGIGTVSGNVVNTGGAVMPGDAPGILTFDNNYTQGTGGALDIMLGGTTGGTGYSQLLVNSQANLQGALDLSLVNGFNLSNGDMFDILGTGQGLINNMTSLSLDGQTCAADGTDMYKCTFGSFFDIFTEITVAPGSLIGGANSADLVLDVTVGGTGAIPEPSTWAMMAIGFAGLGFAGWRKAQRKVPAAA